MTFDESLAKLNIELGDSSNFAFTPEEKTRAMTNAWNDNFVVVEEWDDSLTFVNTSSEYTLPSTVKNIHDIYIDRDSTGFKEPIPSDLYIIVDGVIRFSKKAYYYIPTNSVLYIKGVNKVTISDTIDDNNTKLIEYVLSLAQVRCLKLITNKRALSFLKNDTSMAELVAARREAEKDIVYYRQQFRRDYEGS
jgi:hypothetical protein